MRLSISIVAVVSLLCAISLNYCLPNSPLRRRMVKSVESFASVPNLEPVDSSIKYSHAANRMLADLQYTHSYSPGADDEIRKFAYSDVPKSKESQAARDLLLQYITEDRAVEVISRIQNQWHDVMNSVSIDKELEIKNEVKGIIQTLNPEEFLLRNVFYRMLIDEINDPEKKWKLKQDPRQYFKALIIKKQQDDNELGDFSRARAIQLSETVTPRLNSLLSSVGNRFARVVPRSETLEGAFFQYIMIEGLVEIMKEIETVATSKFVESFPQDFQLHPSDIKGLLGSDDTEDSKWLEHLFRDIRPDWLNPTRIFEELKKSGVIPSELFNKAETHSPGLKTWLTDLSESKPALSRALEDKKKFEKTVIRKFMEDNLHFAADGHIKVSTSPEMLLHFATQYVEKLKIQAAEEFSTSQRFSTTGILGYAVPLLDPEKIPPYLASDTLRKDLAKAYVEYKMKVFHPASTNPLRHFLDVVYPGTSPIPMPFGIYKKLDDFDGRLLLLRDTPLQTGDSRLKGTLYEKMDEDRIQQVNDLAKTLHDHEPSHAQLSQAVEYLEEKAPELKRKFSELNPEDKQSLAKSFHESLDLSMKARIKKLIAKIYNDAIKFFEILAYYGKKIKFSKGKKTV